MDQITPTNFTRGNKLSTLDVPFWAQADLLPNSRPLDEDLQGWFFLRPPEIYSPAAPHLRASQTLALCPLDGASLVFRAAHLLMSLPTSKRALPVQHFPETSCEKTF